MIALVVAAALWILAWFLHPFPEMNLPLERINSEMPAIYAAIGWVDMVMWFPIHSERVGQIVFPGGRDARGPDARSNIHETSRPGST